MYKTFVEEDKGYAVINNFDEIDRSELVKKGLLFESQRKPLESILSHLDAHGVTFEENVTYLKLKKTEMARLELAASTRVNEDIDLTSKFWFKFTEEIS